MGGEPVEGDGDEHPDVLDCCRLGVEVGDGGGLVLGGGVLHSVLGMGVELGSFALEIGEYQGGLAGAAACVVEGASTGGRGLVGPSLGRLTCLNGGGDVLLYGVATARWRGDLSPRVLEQ